MSIPLTDQIHHALDTAATIVHGIAGDQWQLPTPCAGWDVRATTNHVVGGVATFAKLLAGIPAEEDPDADHLGADPAAAYDAAARAAHRMWSRPDVLDGTVTLSFATLPTSMAAVIHLTELVVHGLDLAVATGQRDAIDEDLAEHLLGVMHTMGGIDAFRGPGFFGPEVPVAADRPAHARLLGYVGRSTADVLV